MMSLADRIATSPRQPRTGGVTLINCFEVPAGRQDEFFAAWKTMNTFFRAQPGYIANRLHRAVSPTARYQFINVVEWESADAYQAAHATAEFKERVQRPEWRDFPNVPGLFEAIFEADAEAGVTRDTAALS